MIILEGVDGAGKTTLAHKLAQHFGLGFGERGTKDRKLLYTVTRQDTYTALGEETKGKEPMRIWDRLYYSELVYADIVGRPCEFSPVEQGYVERMIDALNCVVVVCMPPFDVVAENARKDEQMDGVLENLRSIYQSYCRLLTSKRFPDSALIYDYQADDDGDVYDQILEATENYMLERRARTW